MNVSLLEKWVSCVTNADLEDLLNMYSPEALLFATFEQKPLDNPSMIRDYFTNFLSRDGAGVELDPQTITHAKLGEHTASSTGLYTFFFNENDQLVRQKARFTFIFNEEDSGSILHHHSSVIPS
ncbi:MAG: nuclear transport factor 2 family protein [Opitutales bacterium]|nr:nuclear transport factor 2 family protein [Opitutales bacterium]